VKFAVTVYGWFIVAWQVFPVGFGQFAQLWKVCPLVGVAVSVTEVPGEYAFEHVPGQLIPAGAEVTVPEPETTTVMTGLKSAARSSLLLFGVNVQLELDEPAHLSDSEESHWLKTQPVAGVAVTVCWTLSGTPVEQVLFPEPQLSPAPVTVPAVWFGSRKTVIVDASARASPAAANAVAASKTSNPTTAT
jgi:hypothetical protein